MSEMEGEIVVRDHDAGMRMAVDLLEEFGLPIGLLPLANVMEVRFKRSTGYMRILQKKKVEHNFQLISLLVSYDTEINGYIEKKRFKNLKGVKTKETLWTTVNEITVDDPPTGKIHFNITKPFPVQAFAAGQ